MRLESKILVGGCYAAILTVGSACSITGKIVGGAVGESLGMHDLGAGIAEGIGMALGVGLCLPICLGMIARLDKVRPHEIAPNPYAEGADPDEGLDTLVVDFNRRRREEYEREQDMIGNPEK
jgi:hypothetical protein